MTDSEQINRFKQGFPWLDIVAPAVPGRGIHVLDDEEVEAAAGYCDSAAVNGKCKFVPASGAASRMFKAIYALEPDAISKLADNLEKFAFYDSGVFGSAPFDAARTAVRLTGPGGLDYGSKPKAVLKFHRYPDGETRTALAEHLVEGQEYMKDKDAGVKVMFTISPEHRSLFEAAVDEVRDRYEKRYGVRYDIRFSTQDKSTDTLAVTPDNEPFLKEDGSVLRRPAGHGALIHNLNAIEEELVSIKNIDNVSVERLLPVTALYKKALMGKALELRDRIFGYIYAFDQLTGIIPDRLSIHIPAYDAVSYDPFATDECQTLCNEMEKFLSDELCITMPVAKDCRSRALALRAKLNRPIRVCGMVRNQGEPGGGPFIVRASDGSTSLQILEGAQIAPDKTSLLKCSTHFNPVDLVCCLHDFKGDKFNLPDYVDEETGFISSKSYQGRELKALELPGLWNGAMSDWNTMFVEVPIETFNPVKTVLDLLRPTHQQ